MANYEINVNLTGLTSTEQEAGLSPNQKVQTNTSIQNKASSVLNKGRKNESDFIFNERMRRQRRAERVRETRRGRMMIKEAIYSPGASNRLQLAGEGAALYLKNINAAQAVGIGAAALGVYRVVSNYQKDSANMRGASHKSDIINQQQTMITKAATLVGSFAINPILGAITMATMAYGLAMENRKYIHDLRIDEFKKGYHASRLIQDTSEVRF